MNIFKHNLICLKRHGFKSRGLNRHGLNRHGNDRHGLSVIEVLTSIVVALVGLTGVLAMIPFSVKQTQSGLDQDAATTMARNALSNFEASGYKVVSDNLNAAPKQLNWLDAATGNNVTTAAGSPVVCIDPLGFLEGGITSFPFNSPDSPLTIPTVTLARPGVDLAGNPIPFEIADARRMFRLTDDLVFEESDNPNIEDSDLNGPQQIFNEGVDGQNNVIQLNRQSTGAVSWCAIAQPVINDPNAAEVENYKFHVLVFKDRITDLAAPESFMAAAPVATPTGVFAQPLSTITINVPLSDAIRRNDWMMLINQTPGAAPEAFRTNIAFARVTNFSTEGEDATAMSRLTLDGPDFNFTGTTTVVHLRDVVAVFSRTIKLETISADWTVNN